MQTAVEADGAPGDQKKQGRPSQLSLFDEREKTKRSLKNLSLNGGKKGGPRTDSSKEKPAEEKPSRKEKAS